MRRFFTAVLIFLVGITCFAQTVVKEKELGKKLEEQVDAKESATQRTLIGQLVAHNVLGHIPS